MLKNIAIPPPPVSRDIDSMYMHLVILTDVVRRMNHNLRQLKNFAVIAPTQRAHNADTAVPSLTGGDTLDLTVLTGWCDDVDAAIAALNVSVEDAKLRATS